MATINDVKQLAAADTPILFFQCTMPGETPDYLYWSSHAITFQGQEYEARVLKHNLFALQLSADDAMDGMSQLSVVLGNADGIMSQVNTELGFRGAQLTVYFAFVDLFSGTVTTESTMLFRGVSGDPEEITEETLTLNFTNKLSLQRVAIPDVRVQRSCPWNFPVTQPQRQEAKDGGPFGRFSKFYRCGYSPDVGGAGNLTAGQAFTSCDKSRAQCIERGMFNTDTAGRTNNRYGGFEFVPTSYLVRGATDKTSHLSAVVDNTAKYNDPVPMVYGTGWLKAPVVFSRNDGNLTHMEVLLGLGPIQGVLKVVVSDVEVPVAGSSPNMTSTGWYSIVSNGSRQGTFNLDFVDSSGNPQGDPHGSMAVLSVVVPNAISPGTSTPTVQVLMSGIEVDTYDGNGVKSVNPVPSNNPAWIVMDVLQRAGWAIADLDVSTFLKASANCSALIPATDLNGNPTLKQRYGCNLVITKRQSAAVAVRGIRVAASLMLRYGTDGLLELLPEGTLASQQPSQPDGTNSEALANGYPAYEFSDSSDIYSGIARNVHGGSSLIVTSKTISETSNRLSVEFQDEDNEYQQDSLSVSDSNDSDLIGFEVASQSTALGLPNFNQATRILLRQLDKSTGGNKYVQFQTSFRALKIRPGDIIAISYERENFIRTPFRVLKISPSLNYELVTILAQFHDDFWYSDDIAVLQNSGRQPNSLLAIPRPLLGTVAHPATGTFEYFDLALSDNVTAELDGSAIDRVSIGFVIPNKPSATSTYLPIVNLSPGIDTTTGTLAGGLVWYYAVSAVDANGGESGLSFNIPVNLLLVPSNTNTITLKNLSFPASAVSYKVYRGNSPQVLYQIASGQLISNNPIYPTYFSDDGLPPQPIGPPDASFDHANFYYRNEYGGPFLTDTSTSTSIGWANMHAVSGAYVNMVVLITEGTGRGQQRSIIANTETQLTILSPWSILPDTSSQYVVSEAAWKLAAISSHTPAQFDIPYRLGGVIQVTGRAANILNQESNPDLAPITHLALGGGNADVGLPSIPICNLATPGGGDLTVFSVGFADSTNVETVTSGTLQIFYWNELDTPSSYSLSQPVDAVTTTISVNNSATIPYTGQFIQIDTEIMSVASASTSGYTVFRGVQGSSAGTHAAGASILLLDTHTIIMPFAPGYFENRASSNYIYTTNIPDIRISAHEFFVTNAFGNSQAEVLSYAGTDSSTNEALRTLSGGQYALQVNGYMATQQNAAPPLLVQGTHAVRDLRMTMGQAPTGYVITINLMQAIGTSVSEYCQLIYDPSQSTPTNVVDGINLPPLQEQALLTINITLTLLPNYSQALNPGRDLTVTIRM